RGQETANQVAVDTIAAQTDRPGTGVAGIVQIHQGLFQPERALDANISQNASHGVRGVADVHGVAGPDIEDCPDVGRFPLDIDGGAASGGVGVGVGCLQYSVGVNAVVADRCHVRLSS